MADLRDEQAQFSTASLALLAAIAVAGVLYATQSVMVPFVLSLFIASAVSPIVDVQVLRLRFPHPIAVCITLLIVLVVLGLFALLMGYSGQRIVASAGRYMANVDQLDEPITEVLRPIEARLNRWFFDQLEGDISKQVDEQANRIIDDLKSYVPGVLGRTFGTTVNLVAASTLVTIFLIFLLAGRNPHTIQQGIYAEIDVKIRGYILTKTFLSTLTGVLVWISLWLLGLELAEVFGLLAFLLNFIPSIGSVIATLLPIPIAVAQFGEPWRAIAVVAIPGAIQMGIGNGLEPKLMGKELKLHPVTILMALSFWGILWGLVGMLLAAPITAILRIVLLRFETTRWVGNLLAGELPGKDAT